MTYKGYEIRRTNTKLCKEGQTIDVEAWGIYANGDFKGSVRTPDQARDYIDGLTQSSMHRTKSAAHEVQVTEYNVTGTWSKSKVYRR